jgi:hypothetical protein
MAETYQQASGGQSGEQSSGKQLQSGGALGPQALYIEREADKQLYDALTNGHYCYILEPRQSGKSSLRARTARRLAEDGYHCATIDLQGLGLQYDLPTQWYAAISRSIVESLDLDVDAIPGFNETTPTSTSLATQWGRFVRETILSKIDGTVVIFVDEIDIVLHLGFEVGDFFLQLGALYDAREHEPDLARLSLCVMGVASPGDLGPTPGSGHFLTVGRRIRLHDFSRRALDPFEGVLESKANAPAALMDAVYDWTSGHPFQTHRICYELFYGQPIGSQAEEDYVEQLIDRFIQDGTFSGGVESELRRCEQAGTALEVLSLYRKIIEQEKIEFIDGDRGHEDLLVLGTAALFRDEEGKQMLGSRNRVCRRAFNQQWITAHERRLLYGERSNHWHQNGYDSESLLSLPEVDRAVEWARQRLSIPGEDTAFIAESLDHHRKSIEEELTARLADMERAKRAAGEQLAESEKQSKEWRIKGKWVVFFLLFLLGSSAVIAHRNNEELKLEIREVKESAQHEIEIALETTEAHERRARRLEKRKEKERTELRGKIGEMERSIASAEREIERYANEGEEHRKNYHEAVQRRNKLNRELAKLSKEEERLRQELGTLRDRLSRTEEDAEELERQKERALRRIDSAVKSVTALQETLDVERQARKNVERELAAAQSEVEQLQEELRRARDEGENLRGKLEALESERESKKPEVTAPDFPGDPAPINGENPVD